MPAAKYIIKIKGCWQALISARNHSTLWTWALYNQNKLSQCTSNAVFKGLNDPTSNGCKTWEVCEGKCMKQYLKIDTMHNKTVYDMALMPI